MERRREPDPLDGPPETPVDLAVKLADQELHVTWSDGARCTYLLAVLRKHCPCATCRTEREKQTPLLPILKADPAGIRATGAELVGNYAIRFHFSDGHDSGIYDFRYLRTLEARSPGDAPP